LRYYSPQTASYEQLLALVILSTIISAIFEYQWARTSSISSRRPSPQYSYQPRHLPHQWIKNLVIAVPTIVVTSKVYH